MVVVIHAAHRPPAAHSSSSATNEDDRPPHTGFMLVVSFNPGYQRGLKELKPSTRQRFLGRVASSYPEADGRGSRCVQARERGIETAAWPSGSWHLAGKLRNLQEFEPLGLAEMPSTRLLAERGAA